MATDLLNRPPETVARFGVFEADLRSDELRRAGVRVKIQDLPFRALKLFLSRPNEVITREDFRQTLWASDVFVDFDLGIRSAIKRLREALADSAENPIFIETVGRRGYRWIAPVRVEPSSSLALTAAPQAEGPIHTTHENGAALGADPASGDQLGRAWPRTWPRPWTWPWSWPRSWPRSWPGGWKIAGIAVALAAAVLAAVFGLAPFARHPRADSIAVLPFANGSGDASTDYLSDGITESLIGSLTHVPQLKVKSRSSVFRYKGLDVDAQKAGNELGVSALVSGRVTARGERIDVSAELIDARDNTEIWQHHWSARATDILDLQEQIAGDIASKLRSQLSRSERRQVTRQGTQNPEAYDLYLKGRYAWNNRTQNEIAKAIAYFNQALAKDPGYALAYSGIADAYSVLPNFDGNPSEDFAKSNAAARKALDLDPTLAHPHAVLGSNEMQFDWDFSGGEAEFQKSFALDPNDATARQWHADDIAMIGGREKESFDEVNRARELDPLSPVISRVAGGIFVWARQYDQAVAICSRLAQENPSFAIAHDCLAYAYWGKHLYPRVIQEWKLAAQTSGNRTDAAFATALEQGFRSSGWKGALARGIEVRQAERENGYFSAQIIARFYADMGDKEQAFRWLNIAYREHDWTLIGLNTYFQFDPIRSDPRFTELVQKIGLPQIRR